MKQIQTIGFIGLGNMGLPMATNLVKAGYTVYGVDTNAATVEKFAAAGGKTGESIAFIAKEADAVLTSLPTPGIVENIYLGKEGIVEHAGEGLLMIDFSTISPQLNDKIHAIAKDNALEYLGAPVSGSVSGAVNGTLTIMVGGEKAVYDSALPLLHVLGNNPFHLGESPSVGTRIKLLNNLMIGFYTQAVAETVVLGEQMGVDPDVIYDVLNVSFGQSRVYERNYKGYIAKDEFKPGFSTNLLLKDLKLAQEMAQAADSPLPIGDKLIAYYEEAVEKGYGEQDMSAVYAWMRDSLKGELVKH